MQAPPPDHNSTTEALEAMTQANGGDLSEVKKLLLTLKTSEYSPQDIFTAAQERDLAEGIANKGGNNLPSEQMDLRRQKNRTNALLTDVSGENSDGTLSLQIGNTGKQFGEHLREWLNKMQERLNLSDTPKDQLTLYTNFINDVDLEGTLTPQRVKDFITQKEDGTFIAQPDIHIARRLDRAIKSSPDYKTHSRTSLETTISPPQKRNHINTPEPNTSFDKVGVVSSNCDSDKPYAMLVPEGRSHDPATLAASEEAFKFKL